MDTVIPAGQAMVLLLAVDTAWAGVGVPGEALGPAMAGAEDTEEASDGAALTPHGEEGMVRLMIPTMAVHMP